MQRRRLLSGGKQALKAGAAALPDNMPVALEPPPPTRHQLRERPRSYVPKVTESDTQGGQRITGRSVGHGGQVTGDARGVGQPVSGTQYLSANSGAAFAAVSTKVGLARTQGGLVVSGTLTRSAVAITGDEPGRGVTITGEVEQSPDDDVTRRASPMSARGARARMRPQRIEMTESGQPVTGSSPGCSPRITGDDVAASGRQVTGVQHLARAGAPPAAAARSKVAVAQSWGGQRITGSDVEHHHRVTGDAPAAAALLTGSQYQGPATAAQWSEPEATARRQRRASSLAVTGDTPRSDGAVTGTARGAGRDITGTPYDRADTTSGDITLDAIGRRFSIRSPQREAQLRAASGETIPTSERITGAFAAGGHKVTGNLEFAGRPRLRRDDDPAGHGRLTGEGMSHGRVTGDAWSATSRVTGTEGAFTVERNPSERGPRAKPFAGAGSFKEKAVREEAKQLVTGMFG
ncbi:CsoS2 family carboxysome shell protein, partial [Bradyrhizobium sp. STM 3809]|uniref:CsoS2 family carboxysome shell protein n=1 Tax=Bradyrhizobium sp. STM 3809 TaxID=551936 RepID=UPI000552EF84